MSDTQRPSPDRPRRPGPHGAAASGEEAGRGRVYRRFRKGKRRAFREVKPRVVPVAEAVTSLDGEEEPEAQKRGLESRACFIATAAYGSAEAPEVRALRRFRDRRLLPSRAGAALVRLYYAVSPPFARLIARKPGLRAAVRRTLDLITRRAAL